MRSTVLLLTRAAAVAGLLAAAGKPALGALQIVNQVGTSFSPSTIVVAPGDTVRWVWSSGTHTVTSGSSCTQDGRFNAPLTSANPTFEYIIPTGVARISYFCIPHCGFGMTGVITVQSGLLEGFTITMDGNQEVGSVTTSATGNGTASLDVGTNLLSWNISFSGLSSAQTAAHFHGAALPCTNAAAQITLPNGSPIVGSAQLTPTQAADLLAGKWYVNVHTTNFPGGEIRGQVMPSALANPIPGTIPTGTITTRLVTVATGMAAPNWGASAPGLPHSLAVSDQNGTLWMVNLVNGQKRVFLNLAARLVSLGIGGPNSYDERGFLGFAFHPGYAANGLLYTFTSEPVSGPADFTTMPPMTTPNCQSVVAEWQVVNPSDPNAVVNPGSRRELLRIDKPQFNHNGGGLAFGPDGYLYIALGDGGSADDQGVGHGCGGNAQDLNAILGKLLRIDPSGNNSANGQYGIPPGNPFVGIAGIDEIFAYGLRNPWRYSFDSATGDLYCADVGQNKVEEIDLIAAGGNYGWRTMEGSFTFVFNGNQAGYVTDVPLATIPPGAVDPIAEYDHDDGSAIVGGFVYHSPGIAALAGRYVFGDFARTFSNDGRLFYLDASDQIKELMLAGQPALGISLLGFGQDAQGEVYVLGNSTGTPFGSTGVVQRLAPKVCRGDCNCDGSVGFADIDLFVVSIPNNSTAWRTKYASYYAGLLPPCSFENCDVNGNGNVGFDDIDAFVAKIPSPCP